MGQHKSNLTGNFSELDTEVNYVSDSICSKTLCDIIDEGNRFNHLCDAKIKKTSCKRNHGHVSRYDMDYIDYSEANWGKIIA